MLVSTVLYQYHIGWMEKNLKKDHPIWQSAFILEGIPSKFPLSSILVGIIMYNLKVMFLHLF